MQYRVDLTQLAAEVIEEISKDLPQGRQVEWRIGDLPAVTGDPAMLRLAMVNLLSNAMKYTRHVEKPLVEVDVLPAETGMVTLYVRDNGAGFDMKYVDKLFGLFQRLHSTEEYEGTGVGLANVRRIIDRHGGRTWAEGELNKGATFYFTLPAPTN
jgi:chemotaxis family two-component system sensor kinase Cph1